MPRAAGSGAHYTFVLKNVSTGRYDKDVEIALPSVTTIIGRVLNKPSLPAWYYNQTRDNLAGLVAVSMWDSTVAADDLLDTLSDADMLEEWLAENRMRPVDIRNARAEEGTAAHTFLEQLCETYLAADKDPAAPIAVARKMQENPACDGYHHAVADWWLSRQPEVIASEQVVYSLKHGYAGTVDLVWEEDGYLVVTDLKTRKEGQTVRDSDDLQTAAYAEAYEEMTGQTVYFRSVLIVRSDGSWDEPTAVLPREAWHSVLDLYRALRKSPY